MKLVRILTSLGLALLLANCSMDIAIEDISGPDFLKSKVLSSTTGIADGVSDLVVNVELRNSNDTLVVGHIPTIDLLSGNGITLLDCTASNDNGISTCRLRSTIPGIATISIENIPIELDHDVKFDPPARDGTFIQIVASAQNNQPTTDAGNGSYSVTSQIGPAISGQFQEVDGYQIYINTTGAITPTEE